MTRAAAERITHEQHKGKPVTSSDPRKKRLIALFKEATGCTAVTMVVKARDKPCTYRAHCFRKNQPTWDDAGHYEMKVIF